MADPESVYLLVFVVALGFTLASFALGMIGAHFPGPAHVHMHADGLHAHGAHLPEIGHGDGHGDLHGPDLHGAAGHIGTNGHPTHGGTPGHADAHGIDDGL